MRGGTGRSRRRAGAVRRCSRRACGAEHTQKPCGRTPRADGRKQCAHICGGIWRCAAVLFHRAGRARMRGGTGRSRRRAGAVRRCSRRTCGAEHTQKPCGRPPRADGRKQCAHICGGIWRCAAVLFHRAGRARMRGAYAGGAVYVGSGGRGARLSEGLSRGRSAISTRPPRHGDARTRRHSNCPCSR